MHRQTHRCCPNCGRRCRTPRLRFFKRKRRLCTGGGGCGHDLGRATGECHPSAGQQITGEGTGAVTRGALPAGLQRQYGHGRPIGRAFCTGSPTHRLSADGQSHGGRWRAGHATGAGKNNPDGGFAQCALRSLVCLWQCGVVDRTGALAATPRGDTNLCRPARPLYPLG